MVLKASLLGKRVLWEHSLRTTLEAQGQNIGMEQNRRSQHPVNLPSTPIQLARVGSGGRAATVPVETCEGAKVGQEQMRVG